MPRKKETKAEAKKKTNNKKNKGGRPEYKVTKKILTDVEYASSLLLSEKHIAEYVGWCSDTFIQKKKKFPELIDAIKKGRASGRVRLAENLASLEMENPSVAIFKAKCHLEWTEKNFEIELLKQELEIVKLKAQIDYLKSRMNQGDGLDVELDI